MEKSRWARQYQHYLESLRGNLEDFCFAGGTALSLAYLDHRISEDLDFIFLDESRGSEIIPETIASKVSGDYRHETTLQSRNGEWFGERWYLIDGESEIKIDVVRNILVEDLKVDSYRNLPVMSLSGLYESKVRLLALQKKNDQLGLGKGRSWNIRDWIDVFELSQSEKRLGGFLLNEMDTDEQLIADIEDGLDKISGDHLQDELNYLQYHRSINYEDFIQHFRQSLDTWYGHQFPA